MTIVTVNGRRVLIGNNVTVALLLQSLGYPARGIAVALNRAVLPRSRGQTSLSDGARLVVGGASLPDTVEAPP